jgi:hypothetical protein
MRTKKPKEAAIRIVGTKSQISDLLTAFSEKDFTWESNEHFYARRDEPGLYSYYLENFECASQCKNSIGE